MDMTRREFLKLVTIGAGTLAVFGTSSYFYLNNEKMEKAPKRKGKIIADLHTHPHKDHSINKILIAVGKNTTHFVCR